MMAIEAIDHINIRTPDVIGTTAFFAQVLDMTVQDTPGFPDRSQAAWICDESGRAVVHVGNADIRYPWEDNPETSPKGSGRVHHVALRCQGHDAMIGKLQSLALAYETNQIPEIGLRQIFVPEPNGILLELNFFGD